LLSTRVGRMAELAWVEGVSRKDFLIKVLIPLLWSDLLRIALFVFALCMTSFAVPLLLGGSQGTTIEVLIFENVRQSLNWSAALGLSALQTMIVLGLSLALHREQNTKLQNFIPPVPLLEWRGGLVFTFFPSAIVIGGMLLRLPQAFTEWNALTGYVIEWSWLTAGSVMVGLLTGLFTMGLLIALLIAQPSGWLEKLMLGFVAPSTALVGFALLLLWRAGGVHSLIKVSIGLTLIFAPAFYRLYWHGMLQSLRGQVESAQVLGASPWKTAFEILLPQSIETCMFLAGIAAFWAWGDFALSAIVGENTMTLAMLTHGLASSYRLALATLVAWMLIAGGGITFLLFWGVGRVFGARPHP
jgi:thiamine transport system permease protein